jgi:hypothetical protein
MVNGSKDVVWRKEVPFGGQNNLVEGLGGNSSSYEAYNTIAC